MLGCKKKKKKKLSGLVSAWENTGTYTRIRYLTVAPAEKERRASLRPAPRAPVCPGGRLGRGLGGFLHGPMRTSC